MRRRYLNHRRIAAEARLTPLVTTVSEIAMVTHIHRVRNVSGYAVKPVDVLPDGRLALLKPYRIWVEGIFENLLNSSPLYHSSGIHDDNVVNHLGNNAEVVSYKQYASAYLVLDL